MDVDPIRAQSGSFLLSEISISITHIHVLLVCRSPFLVERNPRLGCGFSLGLLFRYNFGASLVGFILQFVYSFFLQ